MSLTVYENETPKRCERVIALGFFDGVHIGHREILSTARAEAKRRGIPLAAFTFSLDADIKDAKRIYTEAERSYLLSLCGVDEVIIADFGELRGLSGEEFVVDYLIDKYGCAVAVVGEDFRFGRGAACGASELTKLLGERGKDCITVSDVKIKDKRVSSSEIKERLLLGEVRAANEALGSPYLIISTVERGRGVGRVLGFPTLNCNIGGARPLRHGVYASSVVIGGKEYRAITNIGICPTFEVREAHAETFIFDFLGDAYDESCRLYLHEFIRDEMRFDSPESLTAQIKCDVATAKEFF